jgi:hypothetical protein
MLLESYLDYDASSLGEKSEAIITKEMGVSFPGPLPAPFA